MVDRWRCGYPDDRNYVCFETLGMQATTSGASILTAPATIENLNSDLSQGVRGKLTQYAEIVAAIVGERLSGLTVYGDVLTPAFEPSRQAASSVLVLRSMDLGLLRVLAERGATLGSLGMAAPIVMTPGYIDASLDTFPLELIEVYQKRATLAGEDHFAAIAIDDEHLRLQCEREFKRILIRLRQGLLAAGGREDFLTELETDIGLHLLRTIRGLLWLRGHREWLPPDRAMTEVESIAGGALPGARRSLKRSATHTWNDFQALYADAETLARVVDEMG